MRSIYNTDVESMPYSLRTLVDGELDEGEKLLWCGQPIASRSILLSLPDLLPGIMCTSFALFMMIAFFKDIVESGAFRSAWFIPLLGLPFVLLGLKMLSAPLSSYRESMRIAYAVTNHRALIFEPSGRSIDIQSFSPDTLTNVTKRIRSDGSGDLIFNEGSSSPDANRRTSASTGKIGFFAIRDVNTVQDYLDQLTTQPHTDHA